MSLDPRKRQKQQERRAAKRKAKQESASKRNSATLAEQIAAAARHPVHDCWVSDDLWKQGIGYVTLSRELPYGGIAFAMFLVDRYCLGVKNALDAFRSAGSTALTEVAKQLDAWRQRLGT